MRKGLLACRIHIIHLIIFILNFQICTINQIQIVHPIIFHDKQHFTYDMINEIVTCESHENSRKI